MYVTTQTFLKTIRKPPSMQLPHSRFDTPPFAERMSLPLALIQKLSSGPPRNSVYLQCKDFRTVRITLSGIEVTHLPVLLVFYHLLRFEVRLGFSL